MQIPPEISPALKSAAQPTSEPLPPLSGRTQLIKGLLGCLGGFFIHLVIGSVYQWGIVNVYITSYYRLSDPSVSLENNAIVFPVMMTCIGITMSLGVFAAQKLGTFTYLLIAELAASGVIFASSYSPTLPVFIVLYGVVFGLVAGSTFLLPLIQCNKYFPGLRMYVNGFILIGTGLGSAVFGQFSYNFLNPLKLPPNNGYYDSNLVQIAQGVPACVRWLSLFYLCLGLSSAFLLLPVIRQNQKNAAAQTARAGGSQPSTQNNNCPSIRVALQSRIFWIIAFCVVFGSCGDLLINGNYKTYVKSVIKDDQYLTLVGSIGSIGNGCTRFFWNVYFNYVGYRVTMMTLMLINIAILICVRWTTTNPPLYCFMVFLFNTVLGGLLVVTPTKSMMAFGPVVGSNIYCLYWLCFSLANFIQYVFVSQVTKTIGFNNVFWICLGLCALVAGTILVYTFEHIWPVEVVTGEAEAKKDSQNKGKIIQNQIQNGCSAAQMNIQ